MRGGTARGCLPRRRQRLGAVRWLRGVGPDAAGGPDAGAARLHQPDPRGVAHAAQPPRRHQRRMGTRGGATRGAPSASGAARRPRRRPARHGAGRLADAARGRLHRRRAPPAHPRHPQPGRQPDAPAEPAAAAGRAACSRDERIPPVAPHARNLHCGPPRHRRRSEAVAGRRRRPRGARVAVRRRSRARRGGGSGGRPGAGPDAVCGHVPPRRKGGHSVAARPGDAPADARCGARRGPGAGAGGQRLGGAEGRAALCPVGRGGGPGGARPAERG
mmetsp:Transcript_14162/g.46406  ORF Transcript_14162/g.46406 Transcript_14162/m.46406 type:complete len:274 (-) Transcript_14162:351-1172(-)